MAKGTRRDAATAPRQSASRRRKSRTAVQLGPTASSVALAHPDFVVDHTDLQ
jgi:hypothetical protein